MGNELERRIQEVGRIVNEALAKAGFEYTVSSLSLVDRVAKVFDAKPGPKDNKKKIVDNNNPTLTAAEAEECWEMRCFEVPGGTKCIKVKVPC